MFSEKLERTFKEHPEWREPLRRIESALKEITVRPIDPQFVAAKTGLPIENVLAFLQIISEHSLGKFRLRVLDARGLEVASYNRESEIPNSVEDEFGNETVVDPESVHLVFELSEP